MSVHFFGYVFSPSLLPTLCVICLLPILINLGIWQLHRAAQKKHWEQLFSSKSTLLALNEIKQLEDRQLRYRSIQVRGSFDPAHLIYLDNKIHQQQVGYHIFSPFFVRDSKRVLLVDRGFVPAHDRHSLPTIHTPKNELSLKGLIYFPENTFLLKKDLNPASWPLLVQSIKLKELEKVLRKPLYPFYLLLQEGEDSFLIKDWHPVSFPSYRHTGYAIQWFLLAFTLVVIYLIVNISRETL